MTAQPREPVAITEIDRVIERLQMDIDDGGRPDMWSMQSMQECLRKARAVLAAPAPSAEPPAQAATDDLVTRLNYGPADGNDTYATETMTLAAERIKQQAREIAELTAEARTANERHHVETERRVRAEAERDALRECVRAADAMRAECDQVPPMVQQRNALHAYDTARAKVERKE